MARNEVRSVGNAPPPTAHCRWGLDAYFLSKTQTAGTRLSACTCNCMAQPVRWPWSHQFIRDIRYGIVNKSVLYCWNGRTKHNLQRIHIYMNFISPTYTVRSNNCYSSIQYLRIFSCLGRKCCNSTKNAFTSGRLRFLTALSWPAIYRESGHWQADGSWLVWPRRDTGWGDQSEWPETEHSGSLPPALVWLDVCDLTALSVRRNSAVHPLSRKHMTARQLHWRHDNQQRILVNYSLGIIPLVQNPSHMLL